MRMLSIAIFGTLLICVSAQVLGADYREDGDHKATQATPAETVNNDLILGLEQLVALERKLCDITQTHMHMTEGGMDPGRFNLKNTYQKYVVGEALQNIHREILKIKEALEKGKK